MSYGKPTLARFQPISHITDKIKSLRTGDYLKISGDLKELLKIRHKIYDWLSAIAAKPYYRLELREDELRVIRLAYAENVKIETVSEKLLENFFTDVLLDLTDPDEVKVLIDMSEFTKEEKDELLDRWSRIHRTSLGNDGSLTKPSACSQGTQSDTSDN